MRHTLASSLAFVGGLLALGAHSARAEAPRPAGLACLERVYGGKGEARPDGWALVLPSGVAVPWDDKKVKTLDQAMDAPDLQDMFSIRYPTGKLSPITDENHDPGRIRVEALFELAYPKRDLVAVDFLGKKVKFAKRAAAALQRVGERLVALRGKDATTAPFLEALGGTFNERVIAGTTRKSAHSFAVAIDLNPKLSHYWRWSKEGPGGRPVWRNRFPQSIVDAFEAEGFIWGGRWFHYDTMHFEYRPELLDASCYEAAGK